MSKIVLLFVLTYFSSSSAVPCTEATGCSAVCSGKKYEITDILKKESPLKGAENGKYDYSFTCGGSTCGPSVSTAICQNQISNGDMFSCGNVNNVTWTQKSNPFGFSIVFINGADDRSSEIDVIVNSSSRTNLKYSGEDKKKYNFLLSLNSVDELYSRGGGVSAGIIGWVLIFLALVALITYFIVGAIIMYTWKGARGVEIIPNFSFWKNFPILLKDGFMFSLTPCFMCCKRGEYSKI